MLISKILFIFQHVRKYYFILSNSFNNSISLGIDSLAAVELSLDLETEFDVEISDEELAALVTVEDIVKLIESKQ